ncbi:hypothetical protein [Paenibacillus sp. SI8]|uniref:hypothetical protein n=1 Tax=unclassified Paenibacillus TaxID=185978 RepID=UPI0034675945
MRFDNWLGITGKEVAREQVRYTLGTSNIVVSGVSASQEVKRHLALLLMTITTVGCCFNEKRLFN